MLKRSRKKAQLFLFLSLFTVFILSFHLTNTNTKKIQVDPSGASRSQPSFPTYITSNLSSSLSQTKNRILDASDWSKSCTSTQDYNGRSSSVLGRRRAGMLRVEECDLFSGKWVYDNVSHPLYKEATCPYMSDQLACTKHGRPDAEYQKWRWQPHSCDLKRWKGKEMMEKLRGKRLMFVGDSLNRGQWISMVCLLQSLIPSGKKSMSPNAPLTIFKAEVNQNFDVGENGIHYFLIAKMIHTAGIYICNGKEQNCRYFNFYFNSLCVSCWKYL